MSHKHPGMEFLIGDARLALNRIWVTEHFTLWVFRSGMLNLYWQRRSLWNSHSENYVMTTVNQKKHQQVGGQCLFFAFDFVTQRGLGTEPRALQVLSGHCIHHQTAIPRPCFLSPAQTQ